MISIKNKIKGFGKKIIEHCYGNWDLTLSRRRSLSYRNHPVETGRKLNVHKTFRRHPGRTLNVLCTFSLRPQGSPSICRANQWTGFYTDDSGLCHKRVEEWKSTRRWEFSYDNYMIRVLKLRSLRTCLQFFLSHICVISLQKT